MNNTRREWLKIITPTWGCMGRRLHRTKRRQRKHASRACRIRQQQRVTAWRESIRSLPTNWPV